MPQGSLYDSEGNIIWKYDICTEFDCNEEYANKNGIECKSNFTKKPCMFHGEHIEMNLKEGECDE